MTGCNFIKSIKVKNKKYNIFGCYDNDTEENQYSFYDIYDSKGYCINEGSPFYKLEIKSIKSFIIANGG